MGIGQSKLGTHIAFAGLAIADGRRLIPDDVVAAKVRHEHQHIERVGHGKERSAEMSADVVGIPPAELHLDVDGLHVGRNALYPDAGAEKRWPEIDPAAEVRGVFCATEKLQENVSGHAETGQRLKAKS